MANEFDGVGYFLNIPAAVARDKRITSKLALALYGELYALQNVYPDKPIFISNKRLAERYDVTVKAVSDNISKLVEYGYLNRKIVYKPGSKEIEKRFLTVNGGIHRTVDRVSLESSRGYTPVEGEGIPSAVIDKNTIKNTVKKNNNMSGSNEPDTTTTKVATELIEKINTMSGSKFRVTDKVKTDVKARLRDYTSDELMRTVEYLWGAWSNWELRSTYYRPKTLFAASNIDTYVEQMLSGKQFVESNKNKDKRSIVREHRPDWENQTVQKVSDADKAAAAAMMEELSGEQE